MDTQKANENRRSPKDDDLEPGNVNREGDEPYSTRNLNDVKLKDAADQEKNDERKEVQET